MIKIRAIRLREVGCFTSGVALERLGDGLNVLAGRNELGKSTLLEALRIAFTYPHGTTDKRVSRLQPYQGGAPHIEIDFETLHGRWRLAKTYLSGKSAELLNLDTKALLRNSDVQPCLDDMLRGPGGLDRFNMLWVTQKDAFGRADKKTEGDIEHLRPGQSLSALLSEKIDALTVDPDVQRVHALVLASLDALQTGKTSKPKGRLKQAGDDLATLTAHLTSATQRADEQSHRLDALATLAAQRDAASAAGPESIAFLQSASLTASKRLDDALAAQRQEQRAAQVLATCQETLKLAQQTVNALQAADDDLAAAAQAVTEATQALTALTDAETAAGLAQQTAAAKAADLDTQCAALETSVQAARTAETAVTGNATRARLTQLLADARSTMFDRDQARQASNALTAFTPTAITALKAAIRDCDKRDDAFAAVAPEVTIELLPGGAGRISIDGVAVASDAVINPDMPVIIDIAGIGRIHIAPHPATASPQAQAARHAARKHVNDLLAGLGVTTLDDAESALTRRRSVDQRAAELEARLAQLLPNGLERVMADIAALAHHAADAMPPLRPSIELAEELSARRTQQADAARNLQNAKATSAKLDQTRAAAVAALAVHSARIEALRRGRGEDVDALGKRAAAALAVKTAEDSDASARLEHLRWHEIVQSLALPVLETAALTTKQRWSEAVDHQNRRDIEINRLEAALDVASADDSRSEQIRLAEAVEIAKRKLADVEDERAALVVLHQAFEAAASAGRDLISGPVRARIEPFLTRVFPNASLALDAGFGPASLNRPGSAETLDRLSQGTREQIAIITRLGLGKLLAEQQSAVPLILDDALVFADDDRIEAMFDALAAAAHDHQIIIFTCRTKSFANLLAQPGTTMLNLVPWTSLVPA